MAIVINGSGTVTGLAVGGLPDSTVDAGTLASGINKTSITDGGNATAITIDSSERLGIGTTSPQNKVHIATGDSSNNNFRTGADTPLIIETAGSASYIEFVADSGQPMGILMGDTSNSNDTASGGVTYDSNAGGLRLTSGGAHRLYAATNGKIGINGEASPDAALHIGGSSGWIDIGAGNRAKVGFDSNHMYMGSSASAGKVVFKSGITSDGNPADSGTEIAAFLATGGIAFNGDTATANALDDYEEGTFTATLSAQTAPNSAVTATGRYTKIGNFVNWNIHRFANFNSTGASGHMKVTGMPFSAAHSVVYTTMASHHMNFNPDKFQWYEQGASGTQLDFLESQNGGAWQNWNITAGTGKYLSLAGGYEAS